WPEPVLIDDPVVEAPPVPAPPAPALGPDDAASPEDVVLVSLLLLQLDAKIPLTRTNAATRFIMALTSTVSPGRCQEADEARGGTVTGQNDRNGPSKMRSTSLAASETSTPGAALARCADSA